ncbi:nitrogenase component 1 [Blastochloris viridis]|uniref:Nitrogenase molybdenum-iron protein beta chain n=1 Tax=Blastochloris viridis TaxID=1079 RepID=A0A0H5BEV7_BLAVI|nr:nitrogenase component 1 [Blastochloris viridis]ALK09360.1 Nitrogenase vanadium-iron protein beta chain [Blastochloris viridis]BAS00761.1 nitrogenase molybdenum-iron protein beta chain [Blastochloris viridis]CUU42023.1 Nitrogenase vanadium-iron protein beta chain [Blastochloris viridis]
MQVLNTAAAPRDVPTGAAFCASPGAIEQVRYGCSLGALASVIAIPNAVPITHCGPGCATKQFHALSGINGYQGGEFHVPSTNLGNREVIFGGADRLDELIAATLKVMEADLYVVQSGCIPGLVGDDVESVVGRYRRRGVPIVLAETSGYRGNNFTGHETVIRAIVDQFVGAYDGPRDAELVNVWSLLPYQNPFWRGDLTEIRRILEGIGLKVNILFGPASAGVPEWRAIPQAAFNLVLSPWLGLATARHLEQVYRQPYLHVPTIPIGATATSAFLRRIAEFAALDRQRVQAFIAAEEKEHYLYLRDFTSFYAGCTSQYQLPSQAIVVSESAYNLAVAAFLVEQLGLNPGPMVITENPPPEVRDDIRANYTALTDGAEVAFIEDGHLARQYVLERRTDGELPIVFGSTWENALAQQLNAPLVEIGYPCTDEVVLSRSYVGYRGALALIERTYTTVVRANTLA